MSESHKDSLHVAEKLERVSVHDSKPEIPDKLSRSRRCSEGDDTASWSEVLNSTLVRLEPLVDSAATVQFDPFRPYSTCLKYSICRAFSFAELASRQTPDQAFFLIPALRAITEDIIFFRFLSKCSNKDRDMVIRHLMAIDVDDKLKHQQSFFNVFRPFQHVLTRPPINANIVDDMKDDLREFWRKSGWPNFGKVNKKIYAPPIREMAQKSDPGMLEITYDFIYRLTSGEVHSTPRTLLRLGWGESKGITDLPSKATFNTSNLGLYHLSVIQVYSTYILCLWFEFFGGEFDTSLEDQAVLTSLREHLMLNVRWPEMVTYEEVNQPVPDFRTSRWPNLLIRALYSAIMNEGFVSGAKLILETRNRKRSKSNEEPLGT